MPTKTMRLNYKTTLAGLGAILTAVGVALTAAFDGNPATVVDYNLLILAIITGVGLMMGRDGDK